VLIWVRKWARLVTAIRARNLPRRFVLYKRPEVRRLKGEEEGGTGVKHFYFGF